MEPLVSRLIVQAAPRPHRCYIPCCPSTRLSSSNRPFLSPYNHLHAQYAFLSRRLFASTPRPGLRERPSSRPAGQYDTQSAPDSSYSQPAVQLSQTEAPGESEHFAQVERESKIQQMRAPWMREGSDIPPVSRPRQAGAMTKGKLLTTPSRMLKLILPLTTRDVNDDRKNIEPLALLVHPQQPLSYLERLIQSELPFIWDEKKGRERAPEINFRAEDSLDEQIGKTREERRDAKARAQEQQEQEEKAIETEDVIDVIDDAQEMKIDGKLARTGKISGGKRPTLGGPKERQHSSAEQQPQPDHDEEPVAFVRWSPSTEIGDFIRDAARAKKFAIDIEGAPTSTYVGVPSFADRTYYLRTRLRKVSRQILQLADVKADCDRLAHRGAKQVAQCGFVGLVGWWAAVYYLTFRTDLGWDVMEPVTYLVGLSGLMGGYLWFLYHNREVSYRSAMHFTMSRRQKALYDQKGFNLPHWEMLIEEGNRLRREIKMVADEYDVDWDETKDEGDEKVREALRLERKRAKHEKGKQNEEDDDDGDDADDVDVMEREEKRQKQASG